MRDMMTAPNGDTFDRQMLRDADECGHGPISSGLLPHQERELKETKARFYNWLYGAEYPVTKFVPKDSDVIYTPNGADDYDAEIND